MVTKDEIDFNQLNTRINSSRQQTYVGKVREAINNQIVNTVNFQAGKTIAFDAQLNGKNAVAMVIEIDKN